MAGFARSLRPLARFLRYCWISRTTTWPFWWPAKQPGKAAPRSATKPPVRLSLDRLEMRETPNDLLGTLTGGFALGQLTLVSGQFPTPLEVFLNGWNARQRGVVPSLGKSGRADAPEGPAREAEEQPKAAVTPSDLLLPKQEQETSRRETGSRQESGWERGIGNEPSWDWLNAVGAFLEGNGVERKPGNGRPPEDEGSKNGGGSGGGGGSTMAPLDSFTPLGGAGTSRGEQPFLDNGGAAGAASGSPSGEAGGTPASNRPTSEQGNDGSSQNSTPTASGQPGEGPTRVEPETKARIVENFAQTRLAFEQNVGQSDSNVRFLSRGAGFGFWMTQDEMVFSVARNSRGEQESQGSDVFRVRLLEMNSSAEVVGQEPLATRSNYFLTDDKSKWLTNVPQYGRIEYREAYPGVDLILRSQTGKDRVFEYDFVVKPGGSVSSVRLRWEGLERVEVDEQGRLLLEHAGGTVVQEAPILYQESQGQRSFVSGRYVLGEQGEVGFEVVGDYDRTRDLIIDPVIHFGSYLGGSGGDEAYDVAVDGSGSSYVTGSTTSSDFPWTDGFGATNGYAAVFVTKLNARGDEIIYSTYLGGTSTTKHEGTGIAVDWSGAAYVVGDTDASNYPTTPGAYSSSGGVNSSFITKLNPTGDALLYSTYLATSFNQTVKDVAVDVHGYAYVTGGSDGFPTTMGVVQPTRGSGQMGTDAYVAKVERDGSDLVWSTYLGGDQDGSFFFPNASDVGHGVAVDADGYVYVTGSTLATNFPVTMGAYQTSRAGATDAFVSKLNSTATTLIYSTYLGGTSTDEAYDLAVTRQGLVHVTGKTNSSGFPTTGGAKQTTIGGGYDAFVTALSADGSSLIYSTFLGGSSDDAGNAIALDYHGRASVGGSTGSSGFPTYNAYQSSKSTGTDGFVARLTTTGTLSYSSFHGGTGTDVIRGLALDLRGHAYVAGMTNSSDLPGVGGYQPSNAGGYDAFLSKILPIPNAPRILSISSDTGYSSSDQITNDATLSITGTADPLVTVTLELAGVGVLGSVAANAYGTWTYDYTGTTLPEGTHAFSARAEDSGTFSDYSAPEFLVDVDQSDPDVYLYAPSTTPSRGPQVRVVARDLVGVPATATVTLDVDLDNDGNFTDPGETGYATGNLSNGQVTLKLPTLSSSGTYPMRARVTDLAGNEGTSSTSTVIVSSVTSAWVATATVLTADPLTGDRQSQLGDVSLSHPLDLDRSPGSQQSGNSALVYHSSSVSQKPIVQVTLPSVNNASLPGTITARLTFDGTAAATVNYSTTGFAPGDVFTLALQATQTITTTGRYGYSVLVQVPGESDQTITGSTFVVAQDSSPFGAGWTITGVDRLIEFTADANGPAGMLRVYGSGGWRFYEGTTTFTSPEGDNGTLSLTGGTYVYATPDGQSWTFDGDGYLTEWVSADGKETLEYRYDGSDRLAGMTAIDGGLTTFSYSGSTSVQIQTVNNRTTTLTLSAGDVTKVTNPDGGVRTFTYSSHRVTKEEFANLENNWAYTAAGTVGTYTWGAVSVNGVTNLSRTTYEAAATVGLTGLAAGTVWARSNDPTSRETTRELDEQGRVLQHVKADGSRDQYEYSSGYLSRHTDARNRTTTFVRDGAGYVTEQIHPDGSVVTYQYQSAFHALTTMINELGNPTTYAYDGSGRRIRSTDALGNHVVYNYDGTTGLLESIEDQRGGVTTLSYDGSRRLTGTVDALGNGTSFAYDANGNLEETTDALLRVTTQIHDSMGRVINTIDALGNTTTYTYNAAGLLLTTTDPLGTQTSIVYDGFKRGLVSQQLAGVGSGVGITQVVEYDDAGREISQRDGAGWTTRQSYDAAGHGYERTDALGGVTRTIYCGCGELVAQRDAVGRWTHYQYDSRGRVIEIEDNLGNTTTLSYDAAGNQTSQTDALNRTTTYQYDELNRQTGLIDPLGRQMTISYDEAGNVSTVSDALNRTTSYAYDALNRPLKVTEAVGSSVQRTRETTYDEVGNVETSKDALGNVTSYTYDARNLRTGIEDALGRRVTISYDEVGNVRSVEDALGERTTFSYDALHRQDGQQDPLGNRTTLVLDGNGNPGGAIDGLGQGQGTAYDPLGRPSGVVDEEGGFGYVVYDGVGAVRLRVDPVGNEWHYVYDGVGREIVRTDPAGEENTTDYDAIGRITSKTDRNGRVNEYDYDNGDRLTGVTWKSSGLVTVNLLTFTYDDNDNLLSASDNAGTVAYVYDELNRAKSYSNVFGQTLTYTYDAEDRVTKREDTFGGVLTSTYDGVGNLTSRQHGGVAQTEVRIDFGYTARNEQETITRYDDVAGTTLLGTTTYSRDAAGRLTGIETKNASNVTLSYYNYDYDNGNRVTEHEWWSQIGTMVYSGTKTYAYDATSQLTDDSTSSYSYDANGNRTMAGYETDLANRMTNDGVYTYTYDAEGNTLTKSKGAGQETWYYTWDNANRLTNVRKTSDGSTTTLSVTYTYDVEGHKVQEDRWKTGVGNTTTRFAWDGQDEYAETDGSNQLEIRYVHNAGIDQPLVRIVSSGDTAGAGHLLTDNLGTIRDVTNGSFVVQYHADPDGFGNVVEINPAWGSRFKYTARELDPDTGLQNNRARWYDSVTGKWLSEDPIEFQAGDGNLYRYVGNVTTTMTDPTGLEASWRRMRGYVVTTWGTASILGLISPPQFFFFTVPATYYYGVNTINNLFINPPQSGEPVVYSAVTPYGLLPHQIIVTIDEDGKKDTYDYDSTWHKNAWWPRLFISDLYLTVFGIQQSDITPQEVSETVEKRGKDNHTYPPYNACTYNCNHGVESLFEEIENSKQRDDGMPKR